MGTPEKMSDSDVLASHYRTSSKALGTVKPYVIGGLISWPAYWVYRGFRWKKEKECLPIYIRKTYYQAKLISLGFISAGLITLTMNKWSEDKMKMEQAKKKVIAESRGWRKYWDDFIRLLRMSN